MKAQKQTAKKPISTKNLDSYTTGKKKANSTITKTYITKTNKDINKYKQAMQPYLTKKGEVRKNLSQTKIAEYNKLVQAHNKTVREFNAKTKQTSTPKTSTSKKTIKAVKLKSGKGFERSVSAYEKSLEKGKEIKSIYIEKKQKEISEIQEKLFPYLTKNGELKKSLSQKKISEYNKIARLYNKTIREFNKSPYRTAKGRQDIAKKIRDKMVENETVPDTQTAETVQKTFMNESIEYLIDKSAMDSTEIKTLAKEYAVDDPSEFYDALVKFAEEYKRRRDFEVPDAMRQDLQDDDFYRLANEYMNQVMNDKIDPSKVIAEIFEDEDNDEEDNDEG